MAEWSAAKGALMDEAEDVMCWGWVFLCGVGMIYIVGSSDRETLAYAGFWFRGFISPHMDIRQA
jgi:hypothetical protein